MPDIDVKARLKRDWPWLAAIAAASISVGLVRIQGLGYDSHAYWAAARGDLYTGAPDTPGAFLYSPAFAQLNLAYCTIAVAGLYGHLDGHDRTGLCVSPETIGLAIERSIMDLLLARDRNWKRRLGFCPRHRTGIQVSLALDVSATYESDACFGTCLVSYAR